MWDLPGGHVEENETPEQCIVREIREEIGIALDRFGLFSVRDFADRTEFTFWKRANLDIDLIALAEGQCLKWFTEDSARETELAYGFNLILEDFFEKAPFEAMPDAERAGREGE